MLVSVVMPFKDAVDHLAEAAGSVLAQGWRELELVLVDDGGTDGSRQVAERVQQAHAGRVVLVSHPGRRNLGTGPSRALGIRSASGVLTAFLDADDVWEPTHLQHQLGLLRANPEADAVYGRAWDWRSWADPTARDALSDLAFAPGAVVPGVRLLAAVLRHGGFATPTCSVLAPTRALLGCAEDLERFPRMYEDQVINTVLQLGGTAVMSGATTAWYRQHPASTTVQEQAGASAGARWDVGREQFLTWLAERPELGPGGDPEVVALLGQARTALAQRTAGRSAPPTRWTLLRRPAVARAARAVRVLRAALGAARDRSPRRAQALELAAERARPDRLDSVLRRFGSDLRGEVLLVGGAVLPDGHADVVRVDARPESGAGAATGPHHPLADLPDRSVDCVVVTGASPSEAAFRSTLRHVRRVTAPGAVVLLELPAHDERAVEVATTALGTDAVTVWDEVASGPPRRPLRVLRALSPH